MKKLKFLFFPTILALAFGLMLSCAKSSSDDSKSADTSSSEETNTSSAITVSGKVQKGPYVQGTEITVRELDSSMIPTGNTFTGTIDDNTGSFSIKGTLTYKIVELSALGYYFNEVSGSLSNATLTLSALSDLTDSSSVNVNLMTHLEKKRVEYLMDNSKMTFAAAKTQAQGEILKMFNIDNVTKVLFPYVTLLSWYDVPEVLEVHVVLVEEVRIVPEEPTITYKQVEQNSVVLSLKA